MDHIQEDILAEPEDPTWFQSFSNGLDVLRANAWFILAAVGILYYVWKNKLSNKYYEWREQKKLEQISAKNKKIDPEFFINREEARIKAVTRFQEEYDKRASQMKEIEKEKEEKKREEKIAKIKSQGGRKLNDNYFPLAGGGFSGYRAPKRSPCSGGSCNNR